MQAAESKHYCNCPKLFFPRHARHPNAAFDSNLRAFGRRASCVLRPVIPAPWMFRAHSVWR